MAKKKKQQATQEEIEQKKQARETIARSASEYTSKVTGAAKKDIEHAGEMGYETLQKKNADYQRQSGIAAAKVKMGMNAYLKDPGQNVFEQRKGIQKLNSYATEIANTRKQMARNAGAAIQNSKGGTRTPIGSQKYDSRTILNNAGFGGSTTGSTPMNSQVSAPAYAEKSKQNATTPQVRHSPSQSSLPSTSPWQSLWGSGSVFDPMQSTRKRLAFLQDADTAAMAKNESQLRQSGNTTQADQVRSMIWEAKNQQKQVTDSSLNQKTMKEAQQAKNAAQEALDTYIISQYDKQQQVNAFYEPGTPEHQQQMDEIEQERGVLEKNLMEADKALAGMQGTWERQPYEDAVKTDRAFESYAEAGEQMAAKLKTGLGKVKVTGSFAIDLESKEEARKQLTYTTDAEKQVYYYTLAKQGEEAANDYLKAIDPDLNRRKATDTLEYARKWVDSGPLGAVAANLYTFPAALGEGQAYVINALKSLRGESIDPYADYNMASRTNEAIRGRTAENIESGVGGFGGQALSFLYQTGMSVGDFLLQAGITGGGGAAGEAISLGFMGARSAQSATMDAYDRGATDTQALTAGFWAGAAEVVFEKFSLESFIKIKNPKTRATVVMNILKQSGTEASEEMATEIANTISDRLVMGENSQYEIGRRGYEQAGFTPEEAKKMAMLDVCKNIGLAGLGGALAGAPTAAVGSMSAYHQRKGLNRLNGVSNEEGAADTASATGAQPGSAEASGVPDGKQAATNPIDMTGQAQTQNTTLNNSNNNATKELQAQLSADTPGAAANTAQKVPQAPAQARTEKETSAISGVTAQLNTGLSDSQVTLSGISSVKGGMVYLSTSDGGTVSAGDVTTGTALDELLAAEPVGRMTKQAVEGYVKSYDPAISTASEYAAAYSGVYQRAKTGMNYQQAALGSETAMNYLSEDARQYAFGAGQRAMERNKTGIRRDYSMQAYDRLSGAEKHNADHQLRVVDALGKKFSKSIRVVDSIAVQGGGEANGMYDPATGEITVALNADQNAYAYIAMHELTHALKSEHSSQWEDFSDWVGYQLQESGQDVDALVKEQMEKHGYDNEAALEEVICNTVPSILQDETVLNDLYKQSPKLFDRIKAFIGQVLETIRSAGKSLGKQGDWKQMEGLAGKGEVLSDIYGRMAEIANGKTEGKTETGHKFSKSQEHYDYSKAGPVYQRTNVTKQDFDALKGVALKHTDKTSVNDFTSEERKATEAWARSFYKELGTKSPYFRATFGEWRMNSTEPVNVVTQKGGHVGDHINVDTGWNINIGKQVFRETDAHKSTKTIKAIPMLDYVDSIVKNAVLVDSRISLKTDGYSTFFHIMYAYVNDGTDTNLVKLTVQQFDDYDGDNLIRRAYKLSNMEVTPNAGPALQAGQAKGATTITISDLFNDVKRVDKNFHPKDPSKVVNDDGTPKVVYHGTGENFTVFSNEGGNTPNAVGYYFTDSQEVADMYAQASDGKDKHTMGLYLQLSNPVEFEANDFTNGFKEQNAIAKIVKSASQFFGQSNFMSSLKQTLKRHGVSETATQKVVDAFSNGNVDGLVVRNADWDGLGSGVNNQYIVFDRTQIKSATDNIGTFDPKNPDIRYSLKETRGMSWEEQLQEIGKQLHRSATLNVGASGKTYAGFGMNDLDIAMDIGVLSKATREKKGSRSAHSLNMDIMASLEHELQYPVAIIDIPDRNSIMAVTSKADSDGLPVVAIIEKNQKVDGLDAHKVITVHERENLAGYIERLAGSAEYTGHIEVYNNRLQQLTSGSLVQFETLLKALETYGQSVQDNTSDVKDFAEDVTQIKEITSRKNSSRATNSPTASADDPTASIPTAAGNVKAKYSLKETDDNVKAQTETLGRVMELTEGYQLNAVEASRMAGKVAREFGSTYDTDNLSRELASVFVPGMSSEQMDDELNDIARRMLAKSQRLDLGHEENMKPLRDKLRNTAISLTDSQWEEAASMAGSRGGYRRSIFGRVKLTQNGTPLDTVWSELSDLNPELFPANASETDMPRYLVEAVDASKPVFENEHGLDMDEAAQYAVMRMCEEYMKLPGVINATREQTALGMARKAYGEAAQAFLSQSEEAFNKALTAIREGKQQKARTEQQLKNAAMREKYNQWRQRDTTIRKQREIRSTAMHGIETDAKAVVSMLEHPTDGRHVNEALRDSVSRFVEALGFDGKTRAQGELRRRIEALGSTMSKAERGVEEYEGLGYAYEIDPDLVSGLDALARKAENAGSISQMDEKDLMELRKWTAAVRHAISTANSFHDQSRLSGISTAGEGTIGELGRRKAANKKKGVLKMADDMLNGGMVDAVHFFERLGRDGQKRYQAIRDGFDKQIGYIAKTNEYIKSAKEETGINPAKLGGKKAKTQTFTVSGGEVTMNKAEIMELYALSKRQQAQGHLYEGGIIIGSQDSVVQVRVTKADVEALTGTLTAGEKAMADKMQRYMARECSKWGNEASMALYGYEKFGERDYYPIRVDQNTTKTTNDNQMNGSTEGLYTLKNMGMTKAIMEGASNPLIIGSIFDTFCRHVDQMARYSAYVVPAQDMMRWYNYQNKEYGSGVKQSIERAYGAKGKSYIESFVRDINNSNRSREYSSGLWETLSRNTKIASVGANLRVAVQQPTAYARAGAEMSPKYLAEGLRHKPQIELAKKYCPIALWKSWGNYDLNVGRTMKDMLLDESSVADKAREWGTKLAEKGDEVTWGALWNACAAEQSDIHPEMSATSTEFYQLVGSRLSEIVDKTQVVDSVFHRTRQMKSKNGIAQMYTAFMAEPMKTYNMLRSAIADYADGRSKESGRKLARVLTTYAVTGLLTSAAAAVVDAMRSGDDDKDWLQKYLESLGENAADNLNPLQLIPYVKDLVSLIHGYDPSRLDMQSIQRLRDVCEQFGKMANGESNWSAYKTVQQTANALGGVLGIPMGPLVRDLNAIWQTVTGKPTAMLSETATLSYGAENLYNAIGRRDSQSAQRLRDKLRASGKTSSAIDGAVAAVMMTKDGRVAEAYAAKADGKAGEVAGIRQTIVDEGYSAEMVDKAISLYGASVQEKEDSTAAEDKALKVSLYKTEDLVSSLRSASKGGSISDAKAIYSEMVADSTAKEPQKAVKQNAVSELKKDYVAAVEGGNQKQAQALADSLENVLSVTDEEMADWVVSAHYDGLRESAIAFDAKGTAAQIEKLYRDGKETSSIASSLTGMMKPLYQEAVKGGRTAAAKKIVDFLTRLGLKTEKGEAYYTMEKIDKWSSEAKSKAK